MITSKDNSHYKRLVALHKKVTRDEEGVFLVEGERELSLSSAIEVIYYTDKTPFVEKIIKNGILAIGIDKNLFEKIAYRNCGVIGVVKKTESHFCDLINPSFLLLTQSIEKSGNLGAMMRTADCAGVDGLIVCDQVVDLFNPNVIRASLGSFFTLPIIRSTSEDAIKFLKKMKIQIVSTSPDADKTYFDIDWKLSSCVVIGSEKDGVTDIWKEMSDVVVNIPMYGSVDSLNASISAGLVLYEVIRQRNFILR